MDISDLGADEHLTAGDIKLPSGLNLDCDPENVVVIINVKGESDDAGTEGESVDAEGSEPEVIKPKKEDDK
jgi:hypothetical protein